MEKIEVAGDFDRCAFSGVVKKNTSRSLVIRLKIQASAGEVRQTKIGEMMGLVQMVSYRM